MSGTQDSQIRDVALFLNGVYQRLPEPCYVPILAVAREGKSRAMLMVDVSDSLLPPGDVPVPPADIEQYLDHLAILHAHFMGDESLEDAALGLCSRHDSIMVLSPAAARRTLELGQEEEFMCTIISGWEMFEKVAPVEAVRIIKNLQQDLQPVLSALADGPRTLLHGDYKFAHLGTMNGVRTIMLDWAAVTFGPPLPDLGWFLAVNYVSILSQKSDIFYVL